MEKLPFLCEADVEPAAIAVRRVLECDGVVVIPTETFYGLACEPNSIVAVERIMELKDRPRTMALPVLAADWAQLEALVRIPPGYRSFLERSWPGPLTAVLPAIRPPAVAEGKTLAVRIPGYPLLCRLLAATGPLTGTSANRHGRPPSITASGAVTSLTAPPNLVLDGGETPGGAPSDLVDLSSETPQILRSSCTRESGK